MQVLEIRHGRFSLRNTALEELWSRLHNIGQIDRVVIEDRPWVWRGKLGNNLERLLRHFHPQDVLIKAYPNDGEYLQVFEEQTKELGYKFMGIHQDDSQFSPALGGSYYVFHSLRAETYFEFLVERGFEPVLAEVLVSVLPFASLPKDADYSVGIKDDQFILSFSAREARDIEHPLADYLEAVLGTPVLTFGLRPDPQRSCYEAT